MTAWPHNALAHRAVYLLRRHFETPEVWPLVREFVHRTTRGKHRLLADYVSENLEAFPDQEEKRDAALRIICQALEAGDLSLLEAQETINQG